MSPSFKHNCTNDHYVVEWASKQAAKADYIVTHYGDRFDIKFLQSRLLYHGLDPLPLPKCLDTWKMSRSTLKLHSNRLASIAAFIGAGNKTPLSGPIWIRAMSGHVPSINYVVKHCEQDVLVLEAVYNKLRRLDGCHPNVQVFYGKPDGCPRCGSEHLESKGYRATQLYVYQKFFCKACKSYVRSTKPTLMGPRVTKR